MPKKTKKKSSSNKNGFKEEIILKMLEISNLIKLHHWKTYSHPVHVATDELYASFNKNMDMFVEVLLGKYKGRFELKTEHLSILKYRTKKSFIDEMEKFKTYLVSLEQHKGLQDMSHNDLMNIRDEILADVNKLLYLMSFK